MLLEKYDWIIIFFYFVTGWFILPKTESLSCQSTGSWFEAGPTLYNSTTTCSIPENYGQTSLIV